MAKLTRREWMMAAAAASSNMDEVLRRIREPKFAARDFDIRKYGARAGADASEAIGKAIGACAAAGGGRVVVPEGEYVTGAIHLKSRVNLHVSKGATLRFSRDPKHYLPLVFTRWEGVECMNYAALIYAFEQTDIAVTGEGTLDGQASEEHWWPWKGQAQHGWKSGGPQQSKARNALFEYGEKNVAVAERRFGEGGYLRPQFIQPYRCQNVLIEGVSIVNSPMWEVHPVLSRNVTVRGVRIRTHGPNNDGCDPESCQDVLIENCLFDTGDDCIAIKSGRNGDGRRVARACENIIVRGCQMKDGHGGVTIGSECSGDVRNVFVENCEMDSPNLDRALRIKTNAQRGGVIENVQFRNVRVGQVADAVVHADFYYEEGEKGPHLPQVRDILVENVTCKKSRHGLYLRAFAKAPIRNVRVKNCKFENVARPDVVENVEGLEVSGR